MSAIQQIYCTHCTHGSSALERREGQLADRMLGYSARAGSLPAQELRRYYRQIERYAYYYLPRDTPAEEKLRLSAATAPKRLVYYPSTGGLQMMAQVCYRPVDTEGRPGSYFAHVLFREEEDGQSRWSPLDCLRLWGAPGWVDEDTAEIPFLLPSLGSLDEMLQGRRPTIDDAVFLSFLKTPADGSFDDPGGVIPERWRRREPRERIAIFGDTLSGLLETDAGHRESLLLVVEPSVAALLFHGMIRLLPPGALRNPISFSTFEPNVDRLGTTLAAVQFHDVSKTDLKGDAYRGRGFALNTFSERRSELRRPKAPYARTMVRRLVEGGFEAVDWRLGSLRSLAVGKPGDLDQLAVVDCLAQALLEPGRQIRGEDWPTSPAAIGYLRQVLEKNLAELLDMASSLKHLVGQPVHVPLLKLLAAEPGSQGTRAAATFLIRSLPGDKIAELLATASIATEAKVDVLAQHVAATAQLPPGCDFLWNEPDDRLLPSLLTRLEPETLEQFYRNVAAHQSDAFLAALFEVCQNDPGNWSPLSRVVGVADEAALLSLYRSHGPTWFQEYPPAEPAMAGKLHAMLESLSKNLQEFPGRLDLLVSAKHLLPDERDRQIVEAWSECRGAILEIGRLERERTGVLRQRPVARIESAARRMAEAIGRALPPNTFQDDRTGSAKQRCLRQVGRQLLGEKAFLSAGSEENRSLWRNMGRYFERGTWPSAPPRRQPAKAGSSGILPWALGGMAVGAIAVAAIFLISRAAGPGRPSSPGGNGGVPSTEPERRFPEPGGVAHEHDGQPSAIGEDEPKPLRPGDDEARRRAAADEAARLEEQLRMAEREGEAEREREAEAARMAALDAQRLAEEEARREAELRAAAEREAKQREEARKERIETFAREHSGAWFVEQPFDDGTFVIPGDALRSGEGSSKLYLGEGRVDLAQASYAFGGGFENWAPETRQDIPELARERGFRSVYLEVAGDGSGAEIQLIGVPKKLPLDVAAERRAEVDKAQRLSRMLASHLQIYHRRATPQEQKDEAFDKLADLLRIQVPQLPDRPRRTSEAYRENPHAYEEAVRRYEQMVEVHQRVLDSVIPTAKEGVSILAAEIKKIESRYRQEEARVKSENEEAQARLKADCRALSVVVFRDAGELAGFEKRPAASEREEARPKGDSTEDLFAPGEPPPNPFAVDDPPKEPMRPQDPPREPRMPEEGSGASARTMIQIEQKRAAGLLPPAVAEVRMVVVGDQGRPLARPIKEAFVFGSALTQQTADGFVRPKEFSDLETVESIPVLDGTTLVRYRFRFYRRSENAFSANHRLLVESAWEELPIVPGVQYTIKLQMGEDLLAQLQGLVSGAGSR